MRACIYGLYDKDGALRYIGKANDPAARLKSHVRDARNKAKTPVQCWINKIGVPEMRMLEADCPDWEEAEKRLIADARAAGERLLNLADGGDQPKSSAEQNRRNAESQNAKREVDPFAHASHALKRHLGKQIHFLRSLGLDEKAEKMSRTFRAIQAMDSDLVAYRMSFMPSMKGFFPEWCRHEVGRVDG